jgi:hypothetical protein
VVSVLVEVSALAVGLAEKFNKNPVFTLFEESVCAGDGVAFGEIVTVGDRLTRLLQPPLRPRAAD